jgi:hypothetical protein
MKRNASLFASAVLFGGLILGGHAAFAGQYSKTASELIIEHNEEASQPQIPGVHVAPLDDESTLDEMVAIPTQQQASASTSSTVTGIESDSQVGVRDPNVKFEQNRTFQGWWKD